MSNVSRSDVIISYVMFKTSSAGMEDMEKLRVIFKLNHSRDGQWLIQAFCPDHKIEYVVGFKSDDEAWQWISGPQSKEWARMRGYGGHMPTDCPEADQEAPNQDRGLHRCP
jgi:hypothetical protein